MLIKKYFNKLRNIIKKTKLTFDKNCFLSIKNDCKKIWNFVNIKLGRKTNKKTIDKIKVNKHIPPTRL